MQYRQQQQPQGGLLSDNNGLNANYMSMSPATFETFSEGVSRQRSLSEVDLAQNSTLASDESRKTLYGSLPFVAAFGMQKREKGLKRFLSAVSLNTLAEVELEEVKAVDVRGEQLEDIDVEELTVTVHLVMAVVVAVVSQFLVGYNTSVMNAPAALVFPGHTTLQWSLAVSSFAVGGPFGAILGGYLSNVLGRKGTMVATSWMFFVGGLLMMLALNVYWLIPARLIIGFASGVSSVVVPVYLGEISPPTLRGTVGTCTQFSLVIGILVSAVAAIPFYGTGGEQNNNSSIAENVSLLNPQEGIARWRILFAVTPFLCCCQLLLSNFLLESPRWLLNKDEHSKDARIVIKRLRGFSHVSDIEQEVQHFLFAAKKHKTHWSSAHSRGAMADMFKNRDLKPLIICCIVLQMAQQFSGINAVFYYSTSFFQGVLDSPVLGTVMVASVNVLATYVALKLMDTSSRRVLLLVSSAGMALSAAAIVVVLQMNDVAYNWMALIAVMSFVSFFEIGLGPIPWLIVAEMFDSKYVATAMSMACIANWTCNFLVGLLFPYVQQYFGCWSFAPFILMCVCAFIFIYFELPETQGKSIDEVAKVVRRRWQNRGGTGGTPSIITGKFTVPPVGSGVGLIGGGEDGGGGGGIPMMMKMGSSSVSSGVSMMMNGGGGSGAGGFGYLKVGSGDEDIVHPVVMGVEDLHLEHWDATEMMDYGGAQNNTSCSPRSPAEVRDTGKAVVSNARQHSYQNSVGYSMTGSGGSVGGGSGSSSGSGSGSLRLSRPGEDTEAPSSFHVGVLSPKKEQTTLNYSNSNNKNNNNNNNNNNNEGSNRGSSKSNNTPGVHSFT